MRGPHRWAATTRLLALLLLAAAGGACASGGMEATAGGSTMLVVQNDVSPPASMSVYLVPEAGNRRFIGSVAPGATETLAFDPLGGGGQYRFIAEATAGGAVTSNALTFSEGSTVRWDLSSNIATVN